MLDTIRARQADITDRLKELDPQSPEAQSLFRTVGRLFELETQLRDGGIRGPLPLTGKEFEEDVAPNALVDGLIYESSTHFIAGASKGGKTYLALQLGMCVSNGHPFLGLESSRRKVLYCSLELSAGMVRNRMRDITQDTGTPFPDTDEDFRVIAPTMTQVPAINLATPEGFEHLERIIALTGTELVVLDTLYKFIPGIDPSSNAEMGPVMGDLNDCASRTGAALIALDHVAKGEHLGPVSHSPLGAQVKGGAARVIIGLRRTSKDAGSRWGVDVESHFGSWDEPIYYERPERPDGTRAYGCVLCTASEAYGLDFDTLRDLFRKHGERDEHGRPVIASKTRLTDALVAESHATGNNDGWRIIQAITRDYCHREGAIGEWTQTRPIQTSDGSRGAVVFAWKRQEDPWEGTS